MKTHNFNVGDKVKRIKPSKWPEEYGYLGRYYHVLDTCDFGITVVNGYTGATPDAFEIVKGAKDEKVNNIFFNNTTSISNELCRLRFQVNLLQFSIDQLLAASKRPRRSNTQLPAKKRSRRANKG